MSIQILYEVVEELFNYLLIYPSSNMRQFKIFCDMDGVLTNFEGAVRKLGPEAEKGLKEDADPGVKQVMYDAIERAGEGFWANMEWMSGAREFWSWLTQFKPVLLSSPGKFYYAASGKTQWVKKNIPGTSLFLEPDKWQYAERNSILIDDMEENTLAWEKLQGVPVLFKNPKQAKDDILKAIHGISPSRAEKTITFETLQDMHNVLMKQSRKIPIAEVIRDLVR